MTNYISISVQIITHYNKVTDIVDDKTFTITIKTIVSSNEEQDIKIRILNESLSMIRGKINEIESKNKKQDESIDTSNSNIINLTTHVSNL